MRTPKIRPLRDRNAIATASKAVICSLSDPCTNAAANDIEDQIGNAELLSDPDLAFNCSLSRQQHGGDTDYRAKSLAATKCDARFQKTLWPS